MSSSPSVNWQYSEYCEGEVATFECEGEVATFECEGLSAQVRACGGRYSVWAVKRGQEIVAEGEDHGLDPCNFLMCLHAAERVIEAERLRDGQRQIVSSVSRRATFGGTRRQST
jgi:hypothetical protein